MPHASGGPVRPASPAAAEASVAAGIGLDPERAEANYRSTYQSATSPVIAITHARIMPAVGPNIDDGTLILRDGRIAAIGSTGAIAVPDDATVVDARQRWVTPGLVDPHDHVGVDGPFGHDDANETSDSVVAGLWIEHTIWPNDPMFERALAGGVTTLQTLPGSAGLINGRTVVLKNVPATSVNAMKFPGARQGVKLACGENPLNKERAPMTRGAEMMAFRNAFIDAADYARRWDEVRSKKGDQGAGERPKRDLGLDTLAEVLRGKLAVHVHCYRADDMMKMIDLSHEFGFKITAFHHATDAYKIAPVLAREKIGVVSWAGDWAGYKMEAFDAILENAAMVELAGGLAAMHSDDPQIIQHLNAEAARTLFAAQRAGMKVDADQALRWITINPARMLGIDAQTGSLEVGKMADVVIWDRFPFSVYARADQVYVDGALLYDRQRPSSPRSDFEFGQSAPRPATSVQPVPSFSGPGPEQLARTPK